MLGPVIFLLLGIGCGRFFFTPEWLSRIDPVITVSLSIVVLCAGVDIGAKRILLKKLREYKARIFLFPFAIAAGSILGGVLMGKVLGMPANEAGSIAAGLGYYSLSSGLLASLGGAELGSLAFVVNVVREAVALLFTPLVAKWLGNHAAIAPAGAASMDTALGVIARSTDEETALFAMINGVVLTIVVPILVPLVYQYL